MGYKATMAMKMMQSDPQSALRAVIADQEQRIITGFRQDKRWALLELARSNDAYFWYTLTPEGRGTDAQERNSERQYYYQFGWTKSLSLFMGNHCLEKGVPLTPSTPESKQWAEAMITLCGKLGICEILLEYDRFGLGELTTPKNNEIHFKVRGQHPGIEIIERDEFDYLSELAVEMGEPIISKLLPMRNEIMTRMSRLVRPWRKHYIQYQAQLDIDAYYQHLGLSWSRANCLGVDSFPNEATFGGQSFGLYKAAIVNLVGWAWKHIDFCQALLLKHPDMELSNLLTIYCHLDDLCGDMAAALEISSQEASHVLSLLTLTPGNRSVHVLLPRNYSPPLIQISEESVINSISGMLSNSPFLFLLAELKNRYPKDWDHAVGIREDIFRKELYQLFPGEPFVTVDRPVKIKAAGKVVTDIDAVIIDRRTGTLCLFQLKWQDFYASSMQKRASKKKNLMETANTWIDVVCDWLTDKDPELIAKVLGLDLPKTGITRMSLFVLGRNFAHFSGDEQPDERAAWGTWPQVIRLFKEGLDKKTLDTHDPLGWLHETLCNESPTLKPELKRKGHKFQLGEYDIVLDPLN